MNREQFDAMYAAYLPPEARALLAAPQDAARTQRAFELAAKGETLDPEIIIYGHSPQAVMEARTMQRLAWVPALGQAITTSQYPDYNPLNGQGPMPAGAIRTSLNPADYPPHEPPPPPATAPVGPAFRMYGDLYQPEAGVFIEFGETWDQLTATPAVPAGHYVAELFGTGRGPCGNYIAFRKTD